MKQLIKFKFDYNNGKTYKINEKEHVITCILKGQIDMPIYLSCDSFNRISKKYGIRKNILYGGAEYVISASARLKPGDSYDEIKGKRIAESKAKEKLYNTLAKISHEITEYLYEVTMDFVSTHNNYAMLANKERQHIINDLDKNN